MAIITRETKVGEIARTSPVTMKVFARHGLDLCCCGIHLVKYAARRHGFEMQLVLAEIKAGIAKSAAG